MVLRAPVILLVWCMSKAVNLDLDCFKKVFVLSWCDDQIKHV